MTPVISLHLFQASRTLFLQSVVEPPSASNIDPRYLKVVTFLISSSPSLTLLSWHEDGGRYSVLLLLTRSPLFSIALLHNSSCSSASLRVFSHNTRSSANNIAWGGPIILMCKINAQRYNFLANRGSPHKSCCISKQGFCYIIEVTPLTKFAVGRFWGFHSSIY